MKSHKAHSVAFLLPTLAALAWIAVPLAEPNDASAAAGQTGTLEVEWRGTVVCLPEAMNELYNADLPPAHDHIYGFKTEAGAYYTLLPTKWSEAVFMDERLRQKILLLKGRVFPQTHVFEVTRIRSIRNGTVCDLFYYCEICSIETISPRACVCCQDPVELVEKPLPLDQATRKSGVDLP
jgi:hypothetical protein